ncbi:arsenate reductase (glutaredoxin) [Frateuria sp. GZRR33]|uniref:arsenate reductase (glutaredoxin) n=1 Tax=Frateuria sp. GZRR33 TaxID=3351535 RepID=UPI003EDBFD3A
MSVRIYHNSRCSKSRGTLELLQARGIEPQIVDYLDTPPSVDELKSLLRLLGMAPRQLLRTGEADYKELGLDDPALGDEAILQAMVAHPKLIERPIVVAGGRAAIGRPPEAVLGILP